MANRIRVYLTSHEKELLLRVSGELAGMARQTGACPAFPVSLSVWVKRRRRAPQREQRREPAEMYPHRRVLDLVEPTQQTLNALMTLAPPEGVEIEISVPESGGAREVRGNRRKIYLPSFGVADIVRRP